jgi:hypothetical protein
MDDEEQHRHGEHCQQRNQGDGAKFKAGEVARRQCQEQQRREQHIVAEVSSPGQTLWSMNGARLSAAPSSTIRKIGKMLSKWGSWGPPDEDALS